MAAFSISKGTLRMNCMNRKIVIAPPPNREGTVMQIGPFTQPRLENRTYSGTCTTTPGIMTVASVAENTKSLPGNLSLEKP